MALRYRSWSSGCVTSRVKNYTKEARPSKIRREASTFDLKFAIHPRRMQGFDDIGCLCQVDAHQQVAQIRGKIRSNCCFFAFRASTWSPKGSTFVDISQQFLRTGGPHILQGTAALQTIVAAVLLVFIALGAPRWLASGRGS